MSLRLDVLAALAGREHTQPVPFGVILGSVPRAYDAYEVRGVLFDLEREGLIGVSAAGGSRVQMAWMLE